ncbi:alpha/beta hydrolase [Dactylosporangium salmoneum]|uniref:Alpha/beta hydrolase n=1 Tax=Dactylosporangium salmoneum TaxID=53361 RepID=A0ABP5TBL1_9ACTN
MSLPVVCGTVTLSDRRVHYRTVPAPADRPLLLMLHQSPLSSRRYRLLLPLLADLVRPVAVDTPGFGESDPPAPHWTVADYAGVVTELVDRFGAGRAILFGRATGAVFALHAAATRPERFRALVLHGMPVYTDEEKADRLAGFAPPYQLDADGGHLDWIWRRIRGEYPWAPPELVTELVRDYLAAGPDFAIGYRRIWQYDVNPAARALSVPTLLIGGGADRIRQMHERATALLPDARVEYLPDATDFVAEQRPEAFAAVLRRFLGPHLGEPSVAPRG